MRVPRVLALLVSLLVLVAAVAPVWAQTDLLSAVVKVEARVPPDARSARTLGTERHGNGVLIREDGLIVTIGYLVIEADEVTVIGPGGVKLPASLIGYDHDTGFGLLKTAIPLKAPPMALGTVNGVDVHDRVLAVTHGGVSGAAPAFVVSKREFAGYWEYLLPEAVFTSPPIEFFGGAALIGLDGTLLGIGSLFVPDAVGGGSGLPGNMFVPIDALKPIMADLERHGRTQGPRRPWIGVTTQEARGRLLIANVQPDTPAGRAGLAPGDIVLGVGDTTVKTLPEFYKSLWAAGPAGTEIDIKVLQGADVRTVKVRSADRLRYLRMDRTY